MRLSIALPRLVRNARAFLVGRRRLTRGVGALFAGAAFLGAAAVALAQIAAPGPLGRQAPFGERNQRPPMANGRSFAALSGIGPGRAHFGAGK